MREGERRAWQKRETSEMGEINERISVSQIYAHSLGYSLFETN